MKRQFECEIASGNIARETGRVPWKRPHSALEGDPPQLTATHFGRFVGLLTVTSAMICVSSAAGEPQPSATVPEQFIPRDTAIALQVPRPDRLIDRLMDPRYLAFLKLSPQYKRFLESKHVTELHAVAKRIAAQLGTTWDQWLRDLTGGGILAAVEAKPGSEPSICVVITARQDKVLEAVSQAFLKLARQDAKDKGKPEPVKTIDHRGLTVHALGGNGAVAYAITGDKLIVSNGVKNLRGLIDRLKDQPGHAANQAGSKNAATGAIADQGAWKAHWERQDPDTVAWAFADLVRLREIDPKRFGGANKPDTGLIFLFGSWLEAFRKAPSITAQLKWSDTELSAMVDLPDPKGGRAPIFKGYVPEPGKGTIPPIKPVGTIASLSLWRDWATIWESRSELFVPEAVQGFAQLDTLAGQFFGGREFGNDVLAAFDPHWRLVIAQQDYAALKPQPDVKYPALAVIAELNSADSDFGERFKVAFQAIVGISNVENAGKKGPALELGSEDVEGVKLATARYMIPRNGAMVTATPNQRYNFTPATAQVGRYLVLSSSVGLARTIIKELKSRGDSGGRGTESNETLVVEADGPELARLFKQNGNRLAMQLMLNRGQSKDKAQQDVELGLGLLRYLGQGRLLVRDNGGATQLELTLRFSN
jgi:hypothetical protein